MSRRFLFAAALALVLALASHGARAAWTRSAGNAHQNTAAASSTCVVSQTLTKGDLIIITGGYTGNNSNYTVTNVTDNIGNTYTLFPGTSQAGADGGIAIWYILSLPTTGVTTITVTYSGTVAINDGYCMVDDMESNGSGTGAAARAPLTGSSAIGTGTQPNPGSITNTSGNLNYVAALASANMGTVSSGWTTNTNLSALIEDGWQISPGGATSVSFSSSPADWAAAIVGFTTTPPATCPKTLATLGAGC